MTECVAPIGHYAEALGRFKGPLRRSMHRFVAPLIRPARFRDSATIGATPALSEITDARMEREMQDSETANREMDAP